MRHTNPSFLDAALLYPLNSPTRGPKYSPGASVLRAQALPSQPISDALFPHQSRSVPVYCRLKKMMMPAMAMPHDHAADRTKLYCSRLACQSRHG